MSQFPEMELLLEAARVRPDPGALRRLASEVGHWERLLKLAGRHGLGPLLYDRLRRHCPDGVPLEVKGALGRGFHANVARNVMMAAELKRVMGWLEADEVPAVAYKGPTLAAWAYGELALREFTDLDILVKPADLTRAVSGLATRGCSETATATGQLPGNNETGLQTPGGCAVDLHWDVSPPYLPPFDASAAWGRLHLVAVDEEPVPTFGPDDTFLVLALHGARHCWFSLSWVSDIAHLVAVAPLDWGRVLHDKRTGRISRVAVLLAADLLGAPVPPAVTEQARRDAAAASVAGRISANIFNWTGDVAGEASGALMHLRMMATFPDRARYLWRRGLQANQTDNEALLLPRPLRPLLHVARPFRILAKLTSRS